MGRNILTRLRSWSSKDGSDPESPAGPSSPENTTESGLTANSSAGNGTRSRRHSLYRQFGFHVRSPSISQSGQLPQPSNSPLLYQPVQQTPLSISVSSEVLHSEAQDVSQGLVIRHLPSHQLLETETTGNCTIAPPSPAALRLSPHIEKIIRYSTSQSSLRPHRFPGEIKDQEETPNGDRPTIDGRLPQTNGLTISSSPYVPYHMIGHSQNTKLTGTGSKLSTSEITTSPPLRLPDPTFIRASSFVLQQPPAPRRHQSNRTLSTTSAKVETPANAASPAPDMATITRSESAPLENIAMKSNIGRIGPDDHTQYLPNITNAEQSTKIEAKSKQTVAGSATEPSGVSDILDETAHHHLPIKDSSHEPSSAHTSPHHPLYQGPDVPIPPSQLATSSSSHAVELNPTSLSTLLSASSGLQPATSALSSELWSTLLPVPPSVTVAFSSPTKSSRPLLPRSSSYASKSLQYAASTPFRPDLLSPTSRVVNSSRDIGYRRPIIDVPHSTHRQSLIDDYHYQQISGVHHQDFFDEYPDDRGWYPDYDLDEENNTTHHEDHDTSHQGISHNLSVPSSMVNHTVQHVWVKRKDTSATRIAIRDDELVDSARDSILRKFANSLGRHCDSADLSLHLPDRTHKYRTLEPDEVLWTAIKASFPAGQKITEAIIIHEHIMVPPRYISKASPRHLERPHEDSDTYFPRSQPMPSPRNSLPVAPSPGTSTRKGTRSRNEDKNRIPQQAASPPTKQQAQTTQNEVDDEFLDDVPEAIEPENPDNVRSPTPAPSRQTTPRKSEPRRNKKEIVLPEPQPSAPTSTPAPAPAPTSAPTSTPASAPASAPAPSSAPAPPMVTTIPPIRVLIVEDNSINLKLIDTFIGRLKVRREKAINGRDAIEKWKEGGFHLILMDIQLPVMNGLEATQEIRRLERVNGISKYGADNISIIDETMPDKIQNPADRLPNPEQHKGQVIIVALTASSLSSDRRRALAAGCNDFLTKPVNFPYLQQKILEWGCMQALIDFDNWGRWKDMAIQEEERARKKAEDRSLGIKKKKKKIDKPTGS